MTPPATAVYTPQGVFQDGQERVKGWLARCFPNRYPALEPETTLPISDWTVMPGFGYHEVIVESPEHGSGPGSFDPRTLRRMLEVYRDRYAHYMGQRGIEFVSIFKNSGLEAGASISHTHSQAIAMPLVPPLMQREISALKAAPSCPYCQIAHREASSPRAIQVKGDWIHLAPFASISPYETWIIPRSHVQDLTHMDEGMLQGLSEILGQAIKRMDLLLDHPPYNYMIHQAGQGYHFNIRIQPITSKAAGFEKDTGIFINTVPPEAAAEDLLSMKV